MSKKTVWFDARHVKDKDKILPLIYHSHLEYMVITREMLNEINPPQKMTLIVQVNQPSDLEEIPTDTIILSASETVLQDAMRSGHKTAYFHLIQPNSDLEIVWKVSSKYSYLVVELVDETNIPLELLIARLQSRETSLIKLVRNLQDMKISLGVMEVGSDGVMFSNESVHEIINVNEFMSTSQGGQLTLTTGKVVEVEHCGMGYRACIDSTSMLTENEGMIIGSTSSGGLLVSSETHFLPYMELRPFRVNAGAVHSYVWTPDDMTAYLTELKGGSRVLCVDTNGRTREISVGRVKIEVRPLLRIVVETDNGTQVNAIVQDDWHIRIFGVNGEPRNASTIKEGDELLAYVCESGRHVGIKIDECIIEK
ncbi:3-dehydroquinate synthase [Brevibacillus antibioticus]|uniref:3-dehydroquinate synthase n=1 Tax=Brevibacillus antibioticus TaxID=2570228 RepID=A0A4U2Y5Q7_9BACL|nr:3-dehydroquinate synthase II [Brevibacillus antibioticus]TKI55082.1 3-dehydroquinate synthase [Brevibacillus antibioticus]